jgi:S-adenosylhomocysteine hydrolase
MRRVCLIDEGVGVTNSDRRAIVKLGLPNLTNDTDSLDSEKLLVSLAQWAGAQYSAVENSAGTRPSFKLDIGAIAELDRHLPQLPADDQSILWCLDDRWLETTERVAPNLMSNIARTFEIPQSLPLIEELLESFGKRLKLAGCYLVAGQHLFGSTLPVLDGLARLGMPYSNMSVLGKAYSAHRLVVSELRLRGAWVHAGSLDYNGDAEECSKEYHERLDRDITETLTQTFTVLAAQSPAERKRSKLLILDDGGRIVGAVQALLSKQWRGLLSPQQISGVEQTRKGARSIRRMGRSAQGVGFSVVNIAESAAKLRFESPMIGLSIVECTSHRLQALGHQGGVAGMSVVVVGYGSVGAAVARACLRHRAKRILVYDEAPERCKEARADGFEIAATIAEALPEGDLIIGCTGRDSIVPGMLTELRSGSIFVSGSTSNTEFLALHGPAAHERIVTIRPRFCGERRHVHSDLVVGRGARAVSILNSGFPINFDGSLDPIRASQIQLTRALMFAGALQAMDAGRSGVGLAPLNDQLANLLENRGAKIVESLDGP